MRPELRHKAGRALLAALLFTLLSTTAAHAQAGDPSKSNARAGTPAWVQDGVIY